ncbi:unnamed protein product, partial [Closterium sp. NIES-54]
MGPGSGQGLGRALGRYGARRWAGTGPGAGQVRAGRRARYWPGGTGSGPSRVRDGAATGPGQGQGRGRSRTGSWPSRVRDGAATGPGQGRGRGRSGTESGPAQVRDGAEVGPVQGRGRGRSGTGSGPRQPASPLPAPSPYTEQTKGLTKRRELESRPALPVRTSHRVLRPRPSPVPGTHAMILRPSSVPLRVPLPAPPESSLPAIPDLESDRAHAASPIVFPILATIVPDPSFESSTASDLNAELVDFAAACRPDYATALVAESESARPPSVGGDCALRTDVLQDKHEDFECLAAAVPRFASMLLAPEKTRMHQTSRPRALTQRRLR